jgi:hypothetical protein
MRCILCAAFLSIFGNRRKQMANSVQILAKIARSAERAGLTVNSATADQVIVDDGGDDILIKYQTADISSPMGGVSDSASPHLGIGTANPGYLVLSKNAAGNDTMATVFDTEETATMLAICAGFANDISIQDGNEGIGTSAELVRIAGNPDNIGLGE